MGQFSRLQDAERVDSTSKKPRQPQLRLEFDPTTSPPSLLTDETVERDSRGEVVGSNSSLKWYWRGFLADWAATLYTVALSLCLLTCFTLALLVLTCLRTRRKLASVRKQLADTETKKTTEDKV